MTHEHADSALADAIWWLKGFQAAHALRDIDPTNDMAGDLRNAREWLKRLAKGQVRLLGLHELTYAVALTEGEFEVLFDGLRESATEKDRELGREAARKILHQLRDEQKAARNGEVLF